MKHQDENGTLVSVILGASEITYTEALERGRRLEKDIVKKIEQKYDGKNTHSGLLLKKEYPVFGASPEGVLGDYIIEIKCPIAEKSFKIF